MMSGFALWSSSGERPYAARLPGRYPWMKTSQERRSSSRRSFSSGLWMSSWMVRLPRLRSLSRPGWFGRLGLVTHRTSAPWAARVLPATGAAMTRLISRMRMPWRQRLELVSGKVFGGPGASCLMRMGLSSMADAWGRASHSAYDRRA